MASLTDRARSDSLGSRRRHAVTIQRARKVSVPKAKKKAVERRQIGRSGDAVLDRGEAKALVLLVSKYVVRLLLDSNRRRALKEKCAAKRCEFFEFAEQAVLANLFWGVENVEKAIRCRTWEAKNRRLQSAEQMLQVPALMDEQGTTAGIRNSHIIATAYLNLALVWKLRRNDWQMALHLLQAFVASPRYSRLDLAPDLWEQLFGPHVTALEACHQNELAGICDNAGRFENPWELQLKEEKMKELENFYQNALDKITGQRAKCYKDLLIYYTVVTEEKTEDDEKPRTESGPASSEDVADGLQRDGSSRGARFQVLLGEGLHDATFGTGCSLKPSEEQINLQHLNFNKPSMVVLPISGKNCLHLLFRYEMKCIGSSLSEADSSWK